MQWAFMCISAGEHMLKGLPLCIKYAVNVWIIVL